MADVDGQRDGAPARPGAVPPDPGLRLLLTHRSVGPMALGALAWLGGCALVFADAAELARGVWYTPTLLAAAHLIGLGFLTTVIVAALLHLAPNMSARTIPAGRGVAVVIWCGAVVFAAGMGADWSALEGLGGALVTAGVIWLLVGAVAMWRGRRGSWPEPLAGLALSSIWLAGVLALGLLALAERHGADLGIDRPRLVGAHVTMAALGWAGGLVVAVGTRLAPMVLIVPPRRLRLARAALAGWHLGVAVVVAAFVVDDGTLGRVGVLVLVLAVALFAAYLIDTVRRRQRRPPVSVVHLMVGAAALLAAGILAVALPAAEATPVALLLALVGFAAGATAGHVLIMAPTMAWMVRYGGRRRTGAPRPRVAHLAPPALGVAEAIAFTVGLALLVAGTRAGSTALATAGAGALTASAALVVVGLAVAAARPYTPPPDTRASLPILSVRGGG